MSQFDFKKSSAHEGPEVSPGFLLWRASTLWRRIIEEVLKAIDLTHPQFVVLATTAWLTKDGESVNQAEIGRQAGLDPNTTSQILRGLQAKGLIERSFAVNEKSKNPVLTPAGKNSLAKAMPAVEKADAGFFASIDLKKDNALKALQILAGL